MQLMFHHMSSQDVYMRFFRRVSALSYDEAQRLCNVDFDKDVAFVAVTGPRDNEEVVGTGAYFLNPSTNLAEVAYMIVPELQGSGLGAALQQRLKEFAVDRGVRGFVAEILEANAAMLGLARRLGKIEIKSEDGTYHITALFT
jgi:RimJ/RimL family protein N-acetyltransferase